MLPLRRRVVGLGFWLVTLSPPGRSERLLTLMLLLSDMATDFFSVL